MSRAICVVDTSVFCEFLAELEAKMDDRETRVYIWSLDEQLSAYDRLPEL